MHKARMQGRRALTKACSRTVLDLDDASALADYNITKGAVLIQGRAQMPFLPPPPCPEASLAGASSRRFIKLDQVSSMSSKARRAILFRACSPVGNGSKLR